MMPPAEQVGVIFGNNYAVILSGTKVSVKE
jgi:hypothetical protein